MSQKFTVENSLKIAIVTFQPKPGFARRSIMKIPVSVRELHTLAPF